MYDGKKLRELCKDFTVLLVDDEDGAREQIYNILILIFKEVFTAKNGKDALSIYKENSIDLIITDITMPVMGGFELLDLVREINQSQKVIVMSAHTEIDMIIQAIRLSVDGYILKPIEANQTFEAIEKAVSNIKLALENIAYQKSLEDKVNSQEKLLIQQLEYDSLTGLPNKEKLYLEFKENASDYSDMIMLNIDNFSQINATYGYLDGDLAIKQIGIFLEEIVTDNLYRGNGDEFIILVKHQDSNKAIDLATKIKNKVYAKRFEISSTLIRITFSIGIVTIPKNETVLPYAKAQVALSDARKLHKNAIGYYTEDSHTKNYQQEMNEWAHKVKLALDFDLLVPYYQPIVDAKTGIVSKYESLARIVEQDEAISPLYFIEPARIAGMATDITRRMILKSFEKFSSTDIGFSINITDDDFKEEYLIDYLQENCKKFDIKPSQVVLEVLENISDYDASHAISQIDKLRTLGFKIAIDDFGAESSNFARVQKLQVDYIKIDGSFIKDIVFNENSLIIVKTIIYYAKHSGLKTVAEYVHNEETYILVKELGIDFVQGYFLSKPLKEIE